MRFLIIPDVHGRRFWKKVIETHPIEDYDKVIFLGDYLDPYPFEGIDVTSAISNFAEIIDFKRKNADKVVLLLGNHDIYYYFKRIGPSRYAGKYYAPEIEMMFEDERDLFQLAYESQQTLFTHSGYLKGWEEFVKEYYKKLKEGISIEPTSDSINSLLKRKDVMRPLESVSSLRGGLQPFGSLIWADWHEHQYNEEYDGKYQVFGHTLQLDCKEYYKSYNKKDIKDGEPIVSDKFAMLDCRHGFVFDEEKTEFYKINDDGSETPIEMKLFE